MKHITDTTKHQKACKKSWAGHKKNTLFFSIIGVGSFIWFLIRVIPKPSRASYPCMRVAAPLASTFVLWLLGLGSSYLFFKRARAFVKDSRFLMAGLCLIIGAITGAVLLSSNHAAAYASVQQATTPVGTAKGVKPGRVVWLYDSSASRWKGSGNGHWWENANTDQGTVDSMVSGILRELTGKPTTKAAWDTLFSSYNSVRGRHSNGYVTGEKVMIKTNFTFCTYSSLYTCVDSMTYSFTKKSDYMYTSPQVIRAILRQLVYVVGTRQSDISVGDPVTYYPNEFFDSCHSEFPDVHYIDYAGKFGRSKVQYSTIPIHWSSRPTNVTQDYIEKHIAEATYLINIANMKSHMGGGITACAKNHYGSLIRLPVDSGYFDLHKSLAFMTPEPSSYRALVDIMGHDHLGGKTLLYMVDGLYAGNHNQDTVPHKWPVAPFNGGWTSSVFASQDPVALESVLFDIFQLDTDSYQYPKIAGATDYLLEAAKADNPPSGTFYDPNHALSTSRLSSLGVFEHWNNPVDRKYSRNLGTGNGIELIFLSNKSTSTRKNNLPEFTRSDISLRVNITTNSALVTIPSERDITLKLFDAQGKMLNNGYSTHLAAGMHSIDLSRVFNQNRKMASGFYVLALYNNIAGRTELATKYTFEYIN